MPFQVEIFVLWRTDFRGDNPDTSFVKGFLKDSNVWKVSRIESVVGNLAPPGNEEIRLGIRDPILPWQADRLNNVSCVLVEKGYQSVQTNQGNIVGIAVKSLWIPTLVNCDITRLRKKSLDGLPSRNIRVFINLPFSNDNLKMIFFFFEIQLKKHFYLRNLLVK